MSLVPKNFSRDFLSQSALTLRSCSDSESADRLRTFCTAISVAPKFYLDHEISIGETLDTEFRTKTNALFNKDAINLPFRTFVIEPTLVGKKGVRPSIFEYFGYDDQSIVISVAIKNLITNQWDIVLSGACVTKDGYQVERSDVSKLKQKFPDGYLLSVVRVACSLLYDITAMLECSNVKVETLPSRPLNKSAAKRGALPFDTYHILTIEPRANSSSTKAGTACGTKKREHLRRGTIVRPDGRSPFWRNGCVVNPNNGAGRVHKDYRVSQ